MVPRWALEGSIFFCTIYSMRVGAFGLILGPLGVALGSSWGPGGHLEAVVRFGWDVSGVQGGRQTLSCQKQQQP